MLDNQFSSYREKKKTAPSDGAPVVIQQELEWKSSHDMNMNKKTNRMSGNDTQQVAKAISRLEVATLI